MNEFVLYFMKLTRNYAMQRKEFALDQLNLLRKVKTTTLFHNKDSVLHEITTENNITSFSYKPYIWNSLLTPQQRLNK